MGDVHRLILQHGVAEARSQAVTKTERQVVDAAAFVMAEEESRLGITHAGFAMTSLLRWTPETGQVAKRESSLGTAAWPKVRHDQHTEETRA